MKSHKKKFKTNWIKIEDLKNIELNALSFYDDRYIKTKIRTYSDRAYTNFHGLKMPENNIECGSFTVISIDCLLVYEKKYYLQVYLEICANKTTGKRMMDNLGGNLFED